MVAIDMATTAEMDDAFGQGGLPGADVARGRARGACPSLEKPMITGDGLLVRLRPTDPTLDYRKMRALCRSAIDRGNGLIEITARGNLQLRGLKSESLAALAEDIADAGIVPETGLVIERSPLSQIDPGERGNAQALAARLKTAIGSVEPALRLAPKLSVVIDSTDRAGLAALTADIRLVALPRTGVVDAWMVAVGGTLETAKPVALLDMEGAIPAVVEILRTLAELGPRARGRDLDLTSLVRRLSYGCPPDAVIATSGADGSTGPHDLGDGSFAFGLRMRFGRMHAGDLMAFLDWAAPKGLEQFRLAPDHCLMLMDVSVDQFEMIELAAANFGFSSARTDAASAIHACAGKGACASGHYDTTAAAEEVLKLPALLDGSSRVHLSACSKGCACPRPTSLTIVGAPAGYGVVVNGAATDEPVAYLEKDQLETALENLSNLIVKRKDAGESVDACLRRLGTSEIAKALRQG